MTTFFGDRLECGSMISATDDEPPSKTHASSVIVGLVRIKALKPLERQGVIFVNFGGPGANPHPDLPKLLYNTTMKPGRTPATEEVWRLMDRYDFVGVIPRGLPGGTQVPCRESFVPDPVMAAENDQQWAHVVAIHKHAADDCRHWLMPFLGTRNHVSDMERARRALGEPVLNFLGYSYGTWVGAAYAATFPQFTGRMVLDSAMNYAATMEELLHDEKWEHQLMVHRTAIQPAASDERYGLGNDAEAILERFRKMPRQAILDWSGKITTPESLVAALVISEWIDTDGSVNRARFVDRIERHTFNIDADLNAIIRAKAKRLADMLGQPSVTATSAYMGPVCGDTPWHRDLDYIRSVALSHSVLYPVSPPSDITLALLCRNLPMSAARRPSLEGLASAPPLLIVQAERDPHTPLFLARKAFIASPGAYMVVALRLTAHAIFPGTNACIDRVVARYLLTGELPQKRFSTCELDPSTEEPGLGERGVPDRPIGTIAN